MDYCKQAKGPTTKFRLSANELRERVLKERLKAMRRRASNEKAEDVA
jgi:hypothetical protein